MPSNVQNKVIRGRRKRKCGEDEAQSETYVQKLKDKMAKRAVSETNNNKEDVKKVRDDSHLPNERLKAPSGQSTLNVNPVICNFKDRRMIPSMATFTPSYLSSSNIVHYFQQYTQGQYLTSRLKKGLTDTVVSMLSDMQLCRTASPFDRRVTAMEWHPSDPNVVAVGSKGGDIIIWNTSTMNNDKFIQGMGAGGIINALKFWPEDYSKVLSAAVDGTMTLHDIEGRDTRILADTLNAYDFWYCSVDVQSSGKFVVAGDNVGHVQFLSYEGKKLFSQRLHKKKVTHCEFSPREEWLLCTASTDQTVQLWDVRMVKDRKSVLYTLKHDCPINSAYFSRTDGCRLLTTDQNNQVRVYLAPEWTHEKTILHPHRFFQHITPIKATWHPLRDLAVIGRYPDPKCPVYEDVRAIDILDVESETVVASLTDPAAPGLVCVNKFNSRGDTLVSGMGVNILLWKRKEELAEIQETLMKKYPKGGNPSLDGSRRRPPSRQPRSGDDDLKKSKTKKTDSKTKVKGKVQIKTKR